MELEFCIRKAKEEPYKPLPLEIFDTIAAAIKVEKDLLEVGARVLQWSYDDGFAVVVLDGETPVGYTRLNYLMGADGKTPPFMELGATWVHPDYRLNGINRKMYNLLLPLHADKSIVATTTNVGSIAVGEECGFVPIHRKQLPTQIWQNSCCCPAKKTGATQPKNADCTLAHGEPQKLKGAPACWFRVTPETALRLGLESCTG